jgi:transcriptional regulator with XRE-family HTH domain
MTFGEFIAEERKKAGLSQKELAARVLKEDGEAISPQYLNDVERDRRNPPSDYILERFAEQLKIDPARVYYYARKLPADIETTKENEQKFVLAFKAYRKGSAK